MKQLHFHLIWNRHGSRVIWTHSRQYCNLFSHGIKCQGYQRTFSDFVSRNGGFLVPNSTLRLTLNESIYLQSLNVGYPNNTHTCAFPKLISSSARLYSSDTLPKIQNGVPGQMKLERQLHPKHNYNFQDLIKRHFVTAPELKCDHPQVSEKISPVKKARSSNKAKKYPLKGKGTVYPVYTDHFGSCKDFLRSLNIATDELEYYPDIQKMKEDDILNCIDRLRGKEIHVIFSLFLIQRIFIEINLERTHGEIPEKAPNSKYWFKLRNGMYKLTSIRCVVFYLELCKLFETPDLDPIKLVDDLAALGIYDHIETLTKKTKRLISVGAKPRDLLNNLALYRGTELFDSKIKLYQVVIRNNVSPFPVELFLSSNLRIFKNKLNVGQGVEEVTKLLNVKEADFLKCWGVSSIDTKSLVDKVLLCQSVGIPQVEIFNSIGILNRISVDDCQRVTRSLCKSGQPGSIFVFKNLEKNIQLRAVNGNRLSPKEPDWTSETDDNTHHEMAAKQKDISGNRKKKIRTKATSTNKELMACPRPIIHTFPESSKVWRVSVFKLIFRLLNLDRTSQKAMYKTDINIDPTELIDVTRNLDFLLNQGFTKEDIKQCPIVLAHPFKHFVRVEKELENLLNESASFMQSPSSPSSSPSSSSQSSSLSSSSSLSPKTSYISNPHLLLSDPVCHLNVLQYFLEKETNFSLNYTHTQSVFEFLN